MKKITRRSILAAVPGALAFAAPFSSVSPARAEQLYENFVQQFRARGIETQTGSFGALMRVGIENDGPVTLVLSTDEWQTRV